MKNTYDDEIYGDDYNAGYDKFQKAGNIISATGLVIGGIGDMIAGRNQKKAQKIMDEANKQYTDAAESRNAMAKSTKKMIVQVVSLKKKIIKKNLRKFVKSYKRLNPQIELQNSQGLLELKRFMFSPEKLDDIQKQAKPYLSYSSFGKKSENQALLMVQEDTIAHVSEAFNNFSQLKKSNEESKNFTDEQKIQNISAIATLSAASICFSLHGVRNAVSSATSVDNAKAYKALCKSKTEKLKIEEDNIHAILNYAEIHLNLLKRFEYLIEEYVNLSAKIIKSKDNIFHHGRIREEKFSQKELEKLAFTLSLVGAVKTIIDSPIISKNGTVFEDEDGKFTNVQQSVTIFEKQCQEMRW